MKNDPIKEFAQMMAEQLKKSKETKDKIIESSESIIEQSTEKPNMVLEVSKYLSRSKDLKEDIKSEHDRLVNISNQSNNIPTTPSNIESQRWNDPLRPLDQEFVTKKEMNDHYGLFLQRIQQQMSTIGGGGEVKFLRLDDVISSTKADNRLVEYDASSGKVQFTDVIGPIEQIHFNLNHSHDEERLVGTLCWDSSDQTLNLTHPGGVTQQIGQEYYVKIRNGTANTIMDGTAVQFIGADQGDSEARLLVGPMLADGTFPSLYALGITTQEIEPGEDGLVTVWGKIRELNTSSFNVGDILYVSPDNAGELTNIKPTAPNNVIPVAAVLKKDETEGEIFVRPTIEQRMGYGRFARTTDQTAAELNTGYPIIFNDTEISNGVSIGTPASRITVADSGFYQFDSSLQVTASSNKGVVLVWFRKNGDDIPLSSRRTTVTNGDTFTLHSTLQISLDANDYVEVVWAATASGILIDANPTPVIGPAVASVLLSVGQIQL